MGQIADVYVDANILIYIVEGNKALASELKQIVEALDAGILSAVTSELTLAEVLIGPLRTNDQKLTGTYRALLQSSNVLRTMPVTSAIIERSAALRCNSMLSLPDSIHLATAEAAGCKYFLTEDRHLAVRPPMVAVGVSALNAILSDWHQS
jgi:predicted nucleic acid-binding protein